MIFPKVTLSREEFIEWIIYVCEAYDIKNEKKERWVKKVRMCIDEAHYFYGMIFIERISFYLILHELIHHFANDLRGYTLLKFWYNLDLLVDIIDILLFRKTK